MKKVMVVFFLFLNMVLPLSALAGTAYLPLYVINGNIDGDGIVTAIQIANISNFKQTVSVTLYNQDGGLLAGQNATIKNGSISTDGTTDANGQITAVVAPFSTLHVILLPNIVNGIVDQSIIQGFGRINSTAVDPANGGGFLVANGFIRDQDRLNAVDIFQRAITINGGNPF